MQRKRKNIRSYARIVMETKDKSKVQRYKEKNWTPTFDDEKENNERKKENLLRKT
jgi:hypothetical protein